MAASTTTSPRFAEFSAEELDKLLIDKNSEKTKIATQYSIKIFHDYCGKKGKPKNEVDASTNEELDQTLRQFFVEIRNCNGERYSVNSLKAIRSGINRYYNEPPFAKGNIVRSTDFSSSARMFDASTMDHKRSGKGDVSHKPVISEDDRSKLQEYFGAYENSPTILIHKVWFEIMLFFCRRGREGLRNLTASSYVVAKDDQGTKYVIKNKSEVSKNHRTDCEDSDSGGVMVEMPGDKMCPVKSYEMYISKRNPDVEALFQKPKLKVKPNEPWFDKVAIGKNSLGDLMSTISKASGLSHDYTNHSIRATTITTLSKVGYEARKIQSISKHKNVNSLDNYNPDASLQQKYEMSRALSMSSVQYASTSESVAVPMQAKTPPKRSLSLKRSRAPSHSMTSQLTQSVSIPATSQPVGKRKRDGEDSDSECDYGSFDIQCGGFLAELLKNSQNNVSISNVQSSTINIYVKK